MTLQKFDAGLKTVCPQTYELAAPANATRCIVWNVYGYSHVIGDDGCLVQIPKVQLDVFNQSSFDPLFTDVQAYLTALHIPYSVQDIAYDPDYELLRMIIQLELI